MFIGSRSTSTILDIFRIGLKEVVRQTGAPSSVRLQTEICSITAKAQDLTKRVDVFLLSFRLRPEATEAMIQEMLDQAKMGARITMQDRICRIQAPPFEWRQLPQLIVLDSIVEQFAEYSLRSQTWGIEVHEYVNTGMNINLLLEMMKERKASDLHLRAGNRPFIRVDNDLIPLDMPIITAKDMDVLMRQLGGETELELLMTEKETSFQYHAAGTGYLRCSGYVKTGAVALAIRLIPEEP